MSATNSRGQKRAGDQLESERTLPVPVVARAVEITSNNSNTTYNFGRDVVNNNWVNNNFYPEKTAADPMKKQESMQAIKAALGDQIVPEAWHDTQPTDGGCMSGTRVNVLAKFMAWVKDDPMNIFWLAGMAGTGKTSIALTLCRMLAADPSVVLGGAFFCSRSAGSISRTEVRRVLPTLAIYLAVVSCEFAAALADAVEEDSRVAHKPVGDQIHRLLVKPLAVLASSNHPIVFVIDALDECSNERELAELIRAIVDFRSDTRVKFILTSRPEMYIRGTPISNPGHSSILQLHTISEMEVETDIRRYVVGTLHTVAPNASWYTDNDVEALIRLASGLFIFAATALKYILDQDNDEDRGSRLNKATSLSTNRTAAKTAMDKMYELVLTEACRDDKVDDDERERMQQFVACILAARTPLSVEALADLTTTTTLKLRGSLARLHSLVYLPPIDVEPGLRTLHASFGDYILSRATAHMRIAGSLGDALLYRGCLEVMIKRLHFNVSQCRSSYEPNPAARPDNITLSLEYACLQWIYHVAALPSSLGIDKEIEVVFQPRFLFWLEVVSTLDRVVRGAAMLMFAASTVRSARLRRFLRDAQNFVASSRDAIEKSAAHIYISALPFAPKDTLIYQMFASCYTGLVTANTYGVDRHGSLLVMTLTAHERVTAVSYSPDGRLLASSSRDNIIRIWDMRTGEEIISLLHDSDQVLFITFTPNSGSLLFQSGAGTLYSWSFSDVQAGPQRLYERSEIGWLVALSPDSSLLASAQEGHVICLWKTTVRQQLAILSGHQDEIRAFSFSTDGGILASGSCGGTIILWNSNTGELIRQLTGNRGKVVYSLSFSSDGARLASTSGDHILIWELHTGSIILALRGNQGAVLSVHFSPDGKSLVSIVRPLMLRLWTLRDDGAEASSIVLDRMTKSAVFSPNGLYIASVSSHSNIYIWDAGGSQQTVSQPLATQHETVNSVAVSPNGAFIVLSVDYETACVWDTRTGQQRFPPLIGSISTMTISSDGRLIAMRCSDNVVRLYDAITGVAIRDLPHGHEVIITTVAFSPDTVWVASGSSDRVICLWNIATGQPSEVGRLFCKSIIWTLTFSPNGQLIAVGDVDGFIHFWQVETGQPAYKPLDTGRYRYSTEKEEEEEEITFPPASAYILSGRRDGSSFFRDISSSWQISTQYSREIITFSPASTHIASGRYDGLCHVWDIRTGQQTLVLSGHDTTIQSITYSPDGRFIVIGAEDSTFRMWSADTGTLLATTPPNGYLASATFTPGGQCIAVSCSEDKIHVRDLEVDRLPLLSDNVCDAVVLPGSRGLDVDGWSLGPAGELLLWVPAEYRDYLQVFPCTMLIAERRVVITADENGLCVGENWTACWRDQNPSILM